MAFGSDIFHQYRHKEHALIAALQILQKIFGFLSIGGKVGGNDVHVIPGSDRFLLFLNGHFLQVRHFTLDVSDRLRLVDRLDMQVDGHGVV